MKTGLNNAVLPTLFIVVRRQYCYTPIEAIDNIVDYYEKCGMQIIITNHIIIHPSGPTQTRLNNIQKWRNMHTVMIDLSRVLSPLISSPFSRKMKLKMKKLPPESRKYRPIHFKCFIRHNVVHKKTKE
jgi:hypothetical protein